MTDYSLKLVQTSSAPIKRVKDQNPPGIKRRSNLAMSDYEIKKANAAIRKISDSVTSRGIDTNTHLNGYNDLVKRIDDSKTKVERHNGILGFGCTIRTITYFDKDGKQLFERYINEDKKINQIRFYGVNGCKTYLWDNNNNGNFEGMKQKALNAGTRSYDWIDKSDNKHGDFDVVTMNNYPRGTFYSRSYDFNKEQVISPSSSNGLSVDDIYAKLFNNGLNKW